MIDIQNHLRGSQEHILDGRSEAPKKPSPSLDLSVLKKSGWLGKKPDAPEKR